MSKITDIFKQLCRSFGQEKSAGRDQLTRSWKTEHDLIGLWKTEDEGGLHMISDQALEFKKNGEGVYYSWATTEPHPYDRQDKISWKWINENTLTIKEDKPDAEWERISYKIKHYSGDYGVVYKRMTSPDFKADTYFKEGFWKVIYLLLQPYL